MTKKHSGKTKFSFKLCFFFMYEKQILLKNDFGFFLVNLTDLTYYIFDILSNKTIYRSDI